jgi:hypothetical protein
VGSDAAQSVSSSIFLDREGQNKGVVAGTPRVCVGRAPHSVFGERHNAKTMGVMIMSQIGYSRSSQVGPSDLFH